MLTISLDTKSNIPLYEQIYRYIKNEISAGNLSAGDKLPSARNLALNIQVSRNTIDMAYGQLLSEGYIDSISKKGYYVNQVTNLVHISSHNSSTEIQNKVAKKNYKYSFSPFSIDLNSFPYNTWRKLSKNCMNDANKDLFLLGANNGDLGLRIAIKKYIHDSRGVNCDAEQIVIGAGADYLLQLLAQLFNKSNRIAFENPTYKQAYKIFKGFGFKTQGIFIDENGINIDELKKSNSSIVYVTPSHQYPLGIVMPIKRRLELLAWCNEPESSRYIIEDDHDSEFRYKGKPIPSLQSLDNNSKVIYLGTFSRAIAPAIRIGYMVLPKPLLDIYNKLFSHYSSTVSRIDQTIIKNFIEEGHFERHLNKMRKIYKCKHDTMLNALKIFKNNIETNGENAGLHLVITFKYNISEDKLIKIASDNSIHLFGLNKHYIKTPPAAFPTILLGYANLSEQEIYEGISYLYNVLTTNII